MVDSRFFVDIMGDVVDSMRETGIVSSSSESSGVYTLVTDNTFSALDSISILDVNYLITSATSTTITISAVTGLDFAGETWKDLAPYYIYGHPVEIANRLSSKNNNPKKKLQKFPLIALFQDFQESHGGDLRIDYTLPFTLLIVESTKSTYISEERYLNVFKPVLYPLYYSLLDGLNESPNLNTIDDDLIAHTKIDRLFWGAQSEYGNDGLIFNSHLDAIEINFDGIEVIKSDLCQ